MDKIYGTAVLTLLFLIIPRRSRYANAIVNPTMKSCLVVSLALSFFFFFNKTSSTEAAPIYARHYCDNTTLFTPNSTYRYNLDTVLSALSSAANSSTNGFANKTAGQNPPDQAYGIFLCHDYLSATSCGDCMATAKQDILQRCPNQRVSTIWYVECMLRYSNESIFSFMEDSPVYGWSNSGKTTDPIKFVQVVKNTVTAVASSAPGKGFATGEANVTTSDKLYVMAQCTPDLTSWFCYQCLQLVISQLALEQEGGMIFTPSCNVRFELYPFYNESLYASAVTVTEPPLPLPHAPPAQGMFPLFHYFYGTLG